MNWKNDEDDMKTCLHQSVQVVSPLQGSAHSERRWAVVPGTQKVSNM